MLGNPPWERVKLQEQEFFAARHEAIAKAPNAAARTRLIKKLVDEDPILHGEFLKAKRNAEGQSVSMRTTGRYPLNGRGDVNTYAVFAELFRSLTGPHGRSGVIVPTGIATDATTQYFFKDLVETSTIAALYDFENRAPLFQDVDSRFKFCLLTMAGRLAKEEAATFAFFLHNAADISVAAFALTPDEIKLLNPNTGTLPIFRTRRDAEITLGIYRRVQVLINENDPVNGNPWNASFMTIFHLSNDSHQFFTREELEGKGYELEGNRFVSPPGQSGDCLMPLIEAKMFHQFDPHWATYDGLDVRAAASFERTDPFFAPMPRYWVAEKLVNEALGGRPNAEMLAFRDIARTTDERTAIFSTLPRSAMGNTSPLVWTSDNRLFEAIANSFVFDFVARQKIGGTHLTYMYLKQLPVLAPEVFGHPAPWSADMSGADWVRARTDELLMTSRYTCGVESGQEPFIWDAERRLVIRAELDAAMFVYFGVNRPEIAHMLDSFLVARRKEETTFGEHRTKRLILETFDALQRAIATGVAYESPLSPPPGQGPRHPAKEVGA